MAGDGQPERLEIPASRLSRDALDGLIEEFVTRDGTDYGAQEHTLEQKKNAVVRQLDPSDPWQFKNFLITEGD